MNSLLLVNFNPDWDQLRRQKTLLLEIPDESDELSGLVSLLDYIQDQAVESEIWTEEEVFGTVKTQDDDNN